MTTTAVPPRTAGEPEVDDLGRAARRRRTLVWVGGLGAGLLVTIAVATGIGPVPISPGTVVRIVGHHLLGWPTEVTWAATADSIVWLVRLPRVLLGAVVGAALAVTGVALQAMVRNVLADPSILGITAGASVGAASAILFGASIAAVGVLGITSLTGTAFVGAIGAGLGVFLIAQSGGRVTSIRLLLAGVAVGFVLSAVTSFLLFVAGPQDGIQAVLFFLLGSLTRTTWAAVIIPVVVFVVGFALLMAWSRRFDAIAIGEDTAVALGTSPTRFRLQALVVVSLMIGAMVAVSGGVGFVGLIVPHVARRFVGGEHRRVYGVSALIGAVFLVWADVVARVVAQPAELPLGIVTAIVGAPFLIVLIRRFHAAAT